MATSNVLTTVCVLTLVIGHVAGQFSTNATMCFEKLDPKVGKMTSDDKGNKPPVLDNLCSNTVEVLQCYRELTKCPETPNCPRYTQVKAALERVCQNLDRRRSCLPLSGLTSCTLHLEKDFSTAQGQHRHKASGLDQFKTCITSSFQTCDDEDTLSEMTDVSDSMGNQAKPRQVRSSAVDAAFRAASRSSWSKVNNEPENYDLEEDWYKSGCLKLASWPFLGVISLLISSGFKRL